MTIQMPTPERIATQSDTVQFRNRTSSFGDGYEITAPEGRNNTRETVSVRWVRTVASEAAALFDTLKATGGFEPIRFTLRDESIERQWKITALSKNFTDPINQIVSATLREDFTP